MRNIFTKNFNSLRRSTSGEMEVPQKVLLYINQKLQLFIVAIEKCLYTMIVPWRFLNQFPLPRKQPKKKAFGRLKYFSKDGLHFLNRCKFKINKWFTFVWEGGKNRIHKLKIVVAFFHAKQNSFLNFLFFFSRKIKSCVFD